MSQDNVEIVRAILADWERGDYSSVGWADPEIEFVAIDERYATRGLDELGRRWTEFLTAWDHLTTRPEEFLDAGEGRVLVHVRFDGRGRASGVPATGFNGAQLFTLRDGKVVRLALFQDRVQALRAAGLSE